MRLMNSESTMAAMVREDVKFRKWCWNGDERIGEAVRAGVISFPMRRSLVDMLDGIVILSDEELMYRLGLKFVKLRLLDRLEDFVTRMGDVNLL